MTLFASSGPSIQTLIHPDSGRTWWGCARPRAISSSCSRRGTGRSARRSPWTWPISFLPWRYSVPPKRWATAVTPGQEATASPISSPAFFIYTKRTDGAARLIRNVGRTTPPFGHRRSYPGVIGPIRALLVVMQKLVGSPGFEPGASRSRTAPAARLIRDGGPHGFGREQLDHRTSVAAVLQDLQLAVRAGPLRQDRVDVLDRLPRAQLIHDIVDELDELDREVSHRDLRLLAEVDQVAVDAIADSSPLVLGDQSRHVLAKTEVARAELEQLGADGLHQGCEADRLLEPGRHVAHAELEGWKARVGAEVPPDLLAVVDRAGLDQELDVVLVLVVRGDVRRNAGARKVRPDDTSIRLQARVPPHPERARRAQREEVRK